MLCVQIAQALSGALSLFGVWLWAKGRQEGLQVLTLAILSSILLSISSILLGPSQSQELRKQERQWQQARKAQKEERKQGRKSNADSRPTPGFQGVSQPEPISPSWKKQVEPPKANTRPGNTQRIPNLPAAPTPQQTTPTATPTATTTQTTTTPATEQKTGREPENKSSAKEAGERKPHPKAKNPAAEKPEVLPDPSQKKQAPTWTWQSKTIITCFMIISLTLIKKIKRQKRYHQKHVQKSINTKSDPPERRSP